MSAWDIVQAVIVGGAVLTALAVTLRPWLARGRGTPKACGPLPCSACGGCALAGAAHDGRRRMIASATIGRSSPSR